MLQLKLNDLRDIAVEKNGNKWKLNDVNTTVDLQTQPNGIISLLHNGKSFEAVVERIDRENKEVILKVNGQRYNIAIEEPIDQLLKSLGMNLNAGKKAESVKAPMPGLILRVMVAAGQQIEKGDPLMILEAMKMENIIKATGSGTIKNIRVTEKTAVEKGAVLIELE